MTDQGARIVSGESVSVLIARKVKPGCEQQFWTLEQRLFDEVGKMPGFLTVNHFPTTAGEEGEYVSILQFDSVEALLRWERSDTRAEILEELSAVLEYEPRRKSITGLEGMFEVSVPMGPPRYKMSLVLVVVIFSSIAVIKPLVNYVAPFLEGLWQTLVIIGIQVPIMTYLVMPTVTRLLSGWLYKK